MKVKLLGAAQGVTGSCYIVETDKCRFAIDCGMHQGSSGMEKRNFSTEAYDATHIDFIILTHAHIDHSGLLPRFSKEGFTGPIYGTTPTCDLLELMLLDSAHIQESEAEWESRKLARQGKPPVDPLYSSEDAMKSIQQLTPCSYDKEINPHEGITVSFRDAGHILGSAFIELSVAEPEGITKIVFSGDLGRPNALLMNNPSKPTMKPDYLFLESTYGDRNHKNENTTREELANAINKSTALGQKTIIPAFAVERTQEIIYSLFLLYKENKLPKNIPIYVDSPLAVRATKIFREHPDYLDPEFSKLFGKGEDPFSMPGLSYVLDVKDSQAINTTEGPGIIISASGMCNAGRIKHHLRHNLYKKGASIIFTGFQAVGTPGRRLVDGAKTLNLFGEVTKVEADIYTIGGFSAHAGQSQILDWLRNFEHPALNVILIHGELKVQEVLKEKLHEVFNLTASIPAYLEELTLIPGKTIEIQDTSPATQMPKINWERVQDLTLHNLQELKNALTGVKNRPWAEQTEIRDQILELNQKVIHLLTHL